MGATGVVFKKTLKLKTSFVLNKYLQHFKKSTHIQKIIEHTGRVPHIFGQHRSFVEYLLIEKKTENIKFSKFFGKASRFS